MAAKRKPPKKPARASVQQISPFLWFDGQAEEAARFYCSVFKKSKLGTISRYPDVGQDVHHRPAGSVMTVEFVLNGLPFVALNGGPAFKFNEAISLMIECDTQDEIDYYWEKLIAGGGAPSACGWLKDKYGLSWQVTPGRLMKMWKDSKSPGTKRAFAAMMDMTKLDIAQLKAAYKGK